MVIGGRLVRSFFAFVLLNQLQLSSSAANKPSCGARLVWGQSQSLKTEIKLLPCIILKSRLGAVQSPSFSFLFHRLLHQERDKEARIGNLHRDLLDIHAVDALFNQEYLASVIEILSSKYLRMPACAAAPGNQGCFRQSPAACRHKWLSGSNLVNRKTILFSAPMGTPPNPRLGPRCVRLQLTGQSALFLWQRRDCYPAPGRRAIGSAPPHWEYPPGVRVNTP